MKTIVYLIGLGLFYVAQCAFALDQLKVITIQHRMPQEMITALRPIVPADVMLSSMNNQLLVRASPQSLAQVEALIHQLDVRRQNLRISMRYNNQAATQIDTVGAYGGAVIHRGVVYPNAQVDMQSQEIQQRNQGTQFMQVSDGGRAYIQIGQRIPFTQQWQTLIGRYVHTQSWTQYIDISTGFYVEPHVLGEQVQLTVYPNIQAPDGANNILFTELATTLTVSRGEWVTLGDILQTKDEISREILTNSNYQSTQNNQLQIRVD